MHQVQVDVVGAKVLEGGIEGRLYVVGMMRVVPELGREINLVAGDARLLDRITNRRLGAVDACRVDVAVAGLECVGDGSNNELVTVSSLYDGRAYGS